MTEPQNITMAGATLAISADLNFLQWLGENADGLGVLIGAFVGCCGLYLQYRRNKILEKDKERLK